MSEIKPFTFPTTGQTVRTVTEDGEPWFVVSDVANVLELGNVHSSLALLDADEKGLHSMETPGGPQRYVTVNEPGLWSLILRSRKPEAKAFKRWVTHEVLPAIRKTGSYSLATFEIPTSFAEALELAARQQRELEVTKTRAAAAEHQVLELAPAAHAWDTLASANGDYSVGDAAKILSRDPSIKTGERRLFTTLHAYGWTYRGAEGRWRAKQSAVELGRLTELPSSHYHPRTGVLVLDPPTVRVLVKGLTELHKRLGGSVNVAALLSEEVAA